MRRSKDGARLVGSLSAAVAMVGSMAASADVSLKPYAAGNYEQTSNVFYEWDGTPQTLGGNAGPRSDTIVATRAGLDAQFLFGQQKVFAKAEGRRFDYRNYGVLDHFEGLLDGGLNWTLARRADGSFAYRHERRMVPFSELVGERVLLIEVEDAAEADVNVNVANNWRWESRVRIRNLDSPRVGIPALALRETSVREGIRYTLSALAVGVDGAYLEGRFAGTVGTVEPAYQQSTAQLAAEYATPAGGTKFNAAIGDTRRNERAGGSISGVTGLLGYQRSLSGKTSINLQLFRTLNSYVTTAGTEIDTGLSLQVIWQATRRIQVTPGVGFTRSEFPGQTFGSAASRRDRYQWVSLDIEYQVLAALSLHPYVRRDLRSSTLPSFGFNANQVGLELLVKVP